MDEIELVDELKQDFNDIDSCEIYFKRSIEGDVAEIVEEISPSRIMIRFYEGDEMRTEYRTLTAHDNKLWCYVNGKERQVFTSTVDTYKCDLFDLEITSNEGEVKEAKVTMCGMTSRLKDADAKSLKKLIVSLLDDVITEKSIELAKLTNKSNMLKKKASKEEN